MAFLLLERNESFPGCVSSILSDRGRLPLNFSSIHIKDVIRIFSNLSNLIFCNLIDPKNFIRLKIKLVDYRRMFGSRKKFKFNFNILSSDIGVQKEFSSVMMTREIFQKKAFEDNSKYYNFLNIHNIANTDGKTGMLLKTEVQVFFLI